MKKIAFALVLSLASLHAQRAGEVPGDDDADGHSRFWTYYDPCPTNYIGSRDWWEGPALSGDWWGVRNYMDDSGVEISASYTNNIAGNPVGGAHAGFTYTDNLSFGLELNMEQLIGWKGLTLTASGLNRAGSSLSQDYVGNQFTVQQVYGGQTAMFYALVMEQRLLEDKISIKAGRFATGDDFASSPIYWLYMNNGIDGNPQALPVNTQFSAYPWAVWAARLRADPTPEFNAMAGVYQVSDRVFNREYHGLDWSIRPGDGVLMISQVGWTPEFFKRPVGKVSDGKAVVATKARSEGKTFQSLPPETEMKGLPGHYWFGAYYSPWQFAQFGATDTATNSYGFYWHADQMVWQEAPGSDQGLTLWSSFVLSPQQNIAKLPFQANAGVVYKGLIPNRDEDCTIFGLVYGKFSRNYARTVHEAGNGYPQYEMVLEWGYRVNLTKFAYIQPDLQWVINPGGTGRTLDALVLGAQMSVTF
ncbi:MAG: carbohydrate porin [Terrimicrobiaceae bacterium]|nr:carbohydrate porin [Terrimicrobiaceae bacterium]